MTSYYGPVPLTPGLSGFGPQYLLRNFRVTLAYHELNGVAATLTTIDANGVQTPNPIAANGWGLLTVPSLNSFTITGNGSQVMVQVTDPADAPDPKTLTLQTQPSTSVPTTSVMYGQVDSGVGSAVASSTSASSTIHVNSIVASSGYLFIAVAYYQGPFTNSNSVASVSDGVNTYLQVASGFGTNQYTKLEVWAASCTSGTYSATVTMTHSANSLSAIGFGGYLLLDSAGSVSGTGTATCNPTVTGDTIVAIGSVAAPSTGWTAMANASGLALYAFKQTTTATGLFSLTQSTASYLVLIAIAGGLVPVNVNASGAIATQGGGGSTVELNDGSTLDGVEFDVAAATGMLLYDNGSDWVGLAVGTAGQVLGTNGTDPEWVTPEVELNSGSTLDAVPFDVGSAAEGDLLYNNGSDWVNLAVGANGKVLGSNGTKPEWVTPSSGAVELNSGSTLDSQAFDVTSAAKGELIYSNGSDWVGLGIGGSPNYLGISSGAPNWQTPSVATTLTGYYNVGISTSSEYNAYGGNAGGTSSTIATPLARAGTLRNLYLNILTNSVNSANTVTVTITLYATPGGTPQGTITVSFAGGTTGVQSNTSTSLTVTAGYLVNISAATNTGTGTLTMWHSLEYDQPAVA